MYTGLGQCLTQWTSHNALESLLSCRSSTPACSKRLRHRKNPTAYYVKLFCFFRKRLLFFFLIWEFCWLCVIKEWYCTWGNAVVINIYRNSIEHRSPWCVLSTIYHTWACDNQKDSWKVKVMSWFRFKLDWHYGTLRIYFECALPAVRMMLNMLMWTCRTRKIELKKRWMW